MVISEESMRYSLRNLAHRKSRSFLTILSILVGIATIFIFISFGWGLYNYTEKFSTSGTVDKLIIQPKGLGTPGSGDSFQLTEDDVKAVKKAEGVYSAEGAYFKTVEVEKKGVKKYTFVIAWNPENPLILAMFGDIGITQGRQLRKGDRGKVVLGQNFMLDDSIFSRGYKLNDNILINGKKLKIIGFYGLVGNPRDDAQIYMTDKTFENLFPNKKLGYGMIVAKVDTDKIGSVLENVEKNLRKSRNVGKGKEDFTVQSYDDLLASFSMVLNMIIGFVILIGLISVVVSAVNTVNTMITSVLERRKEIGVIKSIGAKNSGVLEIFLFESAFIGFIAGVLGVGLGWGLSYLGGKLLASLGWSFLSPYFSVWLFIGCIAFATITGGISGMVPAIKASKINPVNALRYE